MLKKLLKYDYKSNLFYFLLMYGVLMAIAVIGRISIAMPDADFLFMSDDALDVFAILTVVGTTGLYFLACGAVVILTYLLIAMRFYNNMMGAEGYLSFTLPVSEGKHLASKMISGVSMLFLSSLMLLLSSVVMTFRVDFWDGFFVSIFREILIGIHMDHPLIAILYIIEVPVTLAEIVAVIYVSVCVGQLAKKHRVLGAIGIYLAINLVYGIISTMGSEILRMLFGNSIGSVSYFAATSIATIFYHSLITVGSLIVSLYLMKHKLNLE